MDKFEDRIRAVDGRRAEITMTLTHSECVSIEEAIGTADDALAGEMFACGDNGDDEGACLRSDDRKWLRRLSLLFNSAIALTEDPALHRAMMSGDSAAVEAPSHDATSGSTFQVASLAAGASDQPEGACGLDEASLRRSEATLVARLLKVMHPNCRVAARAALILQEDACSS